MTERHDHDIGLQGDLEAIQRLLTSRRTLLGWLAAGGVTALAAACGGGDGSGTSTTTTSSSSSSGGTSSGACVAFPTETNGPFPADGTNAVNGTVVDVLTQTGIVRSDITASFGSSTTVAAGVPLTLTLTLEDTSTSCALLLGYAIYIWHCDRDGNYSLYSSAVVDENYLRGVQATDSNGQVTFQTIFPACYSGRYPHIHVEVYPSLASATGQANAVLTTQLAMPRDICTAVYSGATGYSASVANLAQVTTSSDNVFESSTSAEITAQTPSMTGSVSTGYVATATLGIAV